MKRKTNIRDSSFCRGLAPRLELTDALQGVCAPRVKDHCSEGEIPSLGNIRNISSKICSWCNLLKLWPRFFALIQLGFVIIFHFPNDSLNYYFSKSSLKNSHIYLWMSAIYKLLLMAICEPRLSDDIQHIFEIHNHTSALFQIGFIQWPKISTLCQCFR